MAAPILDFTRDLLALSGALVDPAGDEALDVIPGPRVGPRLGLGDYERLTFTPDAREPGARPVDYDSPILERMASLVGELGRWARIRASVPSLRSINPARELDRALSIQNGVFRLMHERVAEVEYVGLVFEYALLSDERAGGVGVVWINPETRSVPRFSSWPDPAGVVDDDPEPADSGMVVPWTLMWPSVRSAMGPAVSAFMESLTRRRSRDLARLRDYYAGIDREIRDKITRGRLSDEGRRRELDRLAATARGYRTRLADAADRYRVRARLTPTAILTSRLPTYRITARLLRRNASAETVFSWNPVDGRVERRACDACQTPVEPAWLCDDRVHYLCSGCLAPCGVCGRPFCRACTAGCPRRHDPVNPPVNPG